MDSTNANITICINGLYALTLAKSSVRPAGRLAGWLAALLLPFYGRHNIPIYRLPGREQNAFNKPVVCGCFDDRHDCFLPCWWTLVTSADHQCAQSRRKHLCHQFDYICLCSLQELCTTVSMQFTFGDFPQACTRLYSVFKASH